MGMFRGNIGRHSAIIAGLLGGVSVPVAAFAQDAVAPVSQTGATADTDAQGADPESAGEILVTGSRIRRSGFNEPTPVTVLGSEDLARRGIANISEALAEVPAFRGTVSQTPSSNTNFLSGGVNAVDLRGLGAARSLVLVDGRRFITDPIINAVNLNLIPTIAIERSEVVTGGASAAWGSDAVAGVVNLILNTRLDGVRAEAQQGISTRGDDAQFKLSAAAGTGFAGERGHVFAAFEYATQDGIGKPATRGWGAQGYSVVTNPTPGANGLPARIVSPNVYVSTLTPGGLVFNTVLRGTEFLPGGATRAFTYGQVFGDAMIGGDLVELTTNANNLKAPADRWSAMGHIDYDLSDSTSLFVEGLYAQTKSAGRQGFNRDSGNGPRAFVVRRDNAYLPETVRAQMVALNLQTINVGRYEVDLGEQAFRNQSDVIRVAGGIKGEFGNGWKWDGYGQYGRYKLHIEQLNYKRTALGALAADAVVVTAANRGTSNLAIGSIACRSTLTNPANGCVPWNIFGSGSTTDAARAYFMANGDFHETSQQYVAAANLSGDLFDTWAGAASFATGAEYRKEQVRATTDAVSAANEFPTGNLQGIAGSYDVKEAYLELAVPLARDMAFARSLEVNGAVRYADYSSSGGVTTWKLGASYSPIDDIRFRAVRSRDIRAPNTIELFQRPTGTTTSLVNRFTNTTLQIRNFAGGNTALRPEKADTKSAGVVVQPSFLRGLRASVDYFNIRVRDLIGPVGAQNVIDFCFQGVQQYCDRLSRDGTTITEIRNYNVNTSSLKTDGFDIEVAYTTRVGDASLNLRALGTNVRSFRTNIDTPTGVISTDRAGQLGPASASGAPSGVPDWTLSFQANYVARNFSVTALVRHIVKGKFDSTLIGPDDPRYAITLPNSVNDNTVPGVTYVNLSADVKVGNRLSFFGVINNLFDQDPPVTPSTTFPVNAAIYDVVGRAFRVGARYGF